MTPDNRALWDLVEKINAQVSTLRKRTKVQHNYLNPLPGHIELLNQCADELESIAGSVNRVDIDENADDVAVNAFASAMKEKLAQSRAKGRGGWNDKDACSQQLLSDMLRKHVEKGDPRDVANFCMFLYMRGEAILERHLEDDADEVVCEVMAIVRNTDGEPSLEFTGEGDLYEIPDGTPVWLLSCGNFDTPEDGWMSLYTKPQAAILERPVVVGDQESEIERLKSIINTPQSDDFIRAVSIEAEHQRQRWSTAHDSGKSPADWFWLIGYLAGKALHAHTAGNVDKAEHHVITTAAACANWHRAMFGRTEMRPGIDGEQALESMVRGKS